jgi:hypothetical protein
MALLTRCVCGARNIGLRRLAAAVRRNLLSGLVLNGTVAGVALTPEMTAEVERWCAGPGTDLAPCCTYALPADFRPAA